MAARLVRAHYERLIARLHVARIISDLGPTPAGIHVIVVPETSSSEIWMDAAAILVHEGRKEDKNEWEVADLIDGERVTPYHHIEAVTLRSGALDIGIDRARCTIFFADHDSDGIDHRSIDLADRIESVVLDPLLVIEAAALCGRVIDAEDAAGMITLPWRRRLVALRAQRDIAETIRMHTEIQAAEDIAKATLGSPTAPDGRRVPDATPLEQMHGYGDVKEWALNWLAISKTGATAKSAGKTSTTAHLSPVHPAAARPRSGLRSRVPWARTLWRVATVRGWEQATDIKAIC